MSCSVQVCAPQVLFLNVFLCAPVVSHMFVINMNEVII